MPGESKPMLRGKLTALWTRDVDSSRLAGRVKMIQAIREEISNNYHAEHLRLRNVLEERKLRSLMGSLLQALRTVLTGHLPSLQCLLFCDNRNHKLILRHLRDNPADILYCDGVRCFYFLQRLSRMRSKMKIVVDMDDLMSRRMELLQRSGLGLSLGYMSDDAPRWVMRFLTHPLLASLIAGWETRALRQVEDEIGRCADNIVLISPVEAAELTRRFSKSGAKARVIAIAPPVETVAPPGRYTHFERFAFIGTDSLPQNYSTIARLIELWKQWSPAATLDIYGAMNHHWSPPPGIRFHGYAENLSDVYTDGTVLLAPGVLRGGLKTKVLEAFAFGCAVAGNEITFEGLGLEDYPQLLDNEAQLSDVILYPESHLDTFRRAAFTGSQLVARSFSKLSFEKAWKDILAVGEGR